MIIVCSSELGRRSLTPDRFGGVGSSWGFGSNEDDADSGPRASWGLPSNPPSTQVDVAPPKKSLYYFPAFLLTCMLASFCSESSTFLTCASFSFMKVDVSF